jgi:VanZ family protein
MIKLQKFFNIKWLFAAVFSTVILIVITHLPQDVMPDRLEVSGLDKLEHIVAYGMITLLFILSLKNSFSMTSAVVLLFFILTIATLDELTQPFFNRIASPVDWLADFIGIAAVLFSFLFLTNSKRQASPNVDL